MSNKTLGFMLNKSLGFVSYKILRRKGRSSMVSEKKL